jgi:hypothetical protein
MAKLLLKADVWARPAPTWRRRCPRTGTLWFLVGLLGLTFFAAALAPAASQSLPLEKGPIPVQQALKTSTTDVPPLDRTQPDRVETFTFGLG